MEIWVISFFNTFVSFFYGFWLGRKQPVSAKKIDEEIRKRVGRGELRAKPGGKLAARVPFQLGETEMSTDMDIKHKDAPREILRILNLGEKDDA